MAYISTEMLLRVIFTPVYGVTSPLRITKGLSKLTAMARRQNIILPTQNLKEWTQHPEILNWVGQPIAGLEEMIL